MESRESERRMRAGKHEAGLNWDQDSIGTVTIREYANGKNGAVVATMAANDEKAVALAILFSESPALLSLAESILAAWDHYERIGPGCTFENGPMIHASTLEELADAARHALSLAGGETK